VNNIYVLQGLGFFRFNHKTSGSQTKFILSPWH